MNAGAAVYSIVKPLHALAWVASVALLSGCGGDTPNPNGEIVDTTLCDVATQKNWLRNYMADWYLWADRSPSPEPTAYATVPDYFKALLFTGGIPTVQPGAEPEPRGPPGEVALA